MKQERPILFSAPMVRAILDGRKTMTRRVAKPSVKGCTVGAYTSIGAPPEMVNVQEDGDPWTPIRCPYGQVGTLLWVKERALYWTGGAGGTSAVAYADDPEIPHLLEDNNRLLMARTISNIEAGEDVVGKWQWRSGRFMARIFSRILLEVTDIRAEKLQEISEKDAIAEGVEKSDWEYSCQPYRNYHLKEGWLPGRACSTAKASFVSLWDSLNAKPKPVNGPDHTISHYVSYPWKDVQETRTYRGKPWYVYGNPWIWRIAFRRIDGRE